MRPVVDEKLIERRTVQRLRKLGYRVIEPPTKKDRRIPRWLLLIAVCIGCWVVWGYVGYVMQSVHIETASMALEKFLREP